MNDRPVLDRNLDSKIFRDYYYIKRIGSEKYSGPVNFFASSRRKPSPSANSLPMAWYGFVIWTCFSSSKNRIAKLSPVQSAA